MANSLELRAPLLDHQLAELALALPDAARAEGSTGKVALRRAFASRPAARDPRAAARPASACRSRSWFREDLRELGRRTCSSDDRHAGAASSGPTPSSACSTSTRAAAPTTASASGACSCSSSGSGATSTRAELSTVALVRRRTALAIVVAAAVVPRLLVAAVERDDLLARPDREERPLRAHSGRERHLRLHPGRAVRLHAAALRVLPRGVYWVVGRDWLAVGARPDRRSPPATALLVYAIGSRVRLAAGRRRRRSRSRRCTRTSSGTTSTSTARSSTARSPPD